MKKIITLIVFTVMLSLVAVPVLAESSTSGASSTPIDVSATYKRPTGGDTIICVDIAWNDMNFTYTQTDMGTWLPGEHRYDNDTSGAWDTTSRSIEITNHSNAPILSAFSFTSTISGMSGTFTHDYLWICSADDDAYRTQSPEGTYPAPSMTTDFKIDPTSPGITESTRLGTITITISTEFVCDFTGFTSSEEVKDVFQAIDEAHISVLNIKSSDMTIFDQVKACSYVTDLTISGILEAGDDLRSFISNFTSLNNLTLLDTTKILDGTFNHTKIKNFSAPKATSIGYEAFQSCDSLQSVSLPEATNIGNYAFQDCGSLQSISLPKATSIGYGAFHDCSSLQSISLPEATNIGDNAFQSCGSLQSISLPEATSIGYEAFQSCGSLQSISLPEATNIGNNAFRNCSDLQSVSLPKATSIGYSAFVYCDNLQSVSLPEATNIGNYAFLNCTDLQSVSLPKIETLSIGIFEGCSSLTAIDIPNVNTVKDSAFENCTSLVSIELPSVTLYTDVFNGCTALRSITFTGIFTFKTINGNFIDDATQVTLTLVEGQLERDETTSATAGVGATFDGKTFAEIIIVPKADE